MQALDLQIILKCHQILVRDFLEKHGMIDGCFSSRLEVKNKVISLTKVLLKKAESQVKKQTDVKVDKSLQSVANHKLFNKTVNFNLQRIKLALKKLNHPERKLSNVIR